MDATGPFVILGRMSDGRHTVLCVRCHQHHEVLEVDASDLRDGLRVPFLYPDDGDPVQYGGVGMLCQACRRAVNNPGDG